MTKDDAGLPALNEGQVSVCVAAHADGDHSRGA